MYYIKVHFAITFRRSVSDNKIFEMINSFSPLDLNNPPITNTFAPVIRNLHFTRVPLLISLVYLIYRRVEFQNKGKDMGFF